MEAQAAVVTKNVNLNVSNSIAGIGNPTSTDETQSRAWAGTTVYYGNDAYLVLDKDGTAQNKEKNGGAHSSKPSHMLLLLKGFYGNGRVFDATEYSSDWTISDIRKDLNHKSSNDGFYDTSFTILEQGAIGETTINNANTDKGNYTGFPSGETNDKIFLLDLNDVENKSYGFANNNTRQVDTNLPNWWLRSPGERETDAALVSVSGTVSSIGTFVSNDGSVRPALNLNLSSVLFSSASNASKSAFEKVENSQVSSNEWKLTLYDGNNGFAAERTDAGDLSGNTTVSIHVSDLGSTGDDYKISAMLVDSDNTVLCYGFLNGGSAAATGDYSLTIPEGTTGGDKLYVFTEQVHAGNATDYASNKVDISTKVMNSRSYNTPTVPSREGIQAAVSYSPTSPQPSATSVTATVTLSGTAATAGTHTIDLSSSTVTITPPAATTKHVNAGDTPTDSFTFSFTVGSSDISDIVLTHTFIADDSTITVNPNTKNFETKTVGYPARPDAQTFTITNTGNTDITAFDVAVTGSDYDVDFTSGTIAKNNGTAVFTVQPKSGLPVGSHAADVTITTTPAQTVAVTVPVSFTVTSVPAPTPSEQKDDNNKNTEGAGSKKTENTYVNPLSWSYAGTKVNSLCTIEQQGKACQAVFKANTPAGYTEGFSFNLSVKENGVMKTSYAKKTGKLVLYLPKEYQKSGRTTALLGIDKSGNVRLFADEDTNDSTIAVSLNNIEGYAFSFIYTDAGAGKTAAGTTGAGTGNIYTVKSGDVLSRIAENLKVSRKYLIDKNNLTNPDKLSIGQKLVY